MFSMLACVCGVRVTHARKPGPLVLPPKCDAYAVVGLNSTRHTYRVRTHLQFWVVLAGKHCVDEPPLLEGDAEGLCVFVFVCVFICEIGR